MLLSQMAVSVAASVLLFISGTPPLTPEAQPIKLEAPVKTAYLRDSEGDLIPWLTLLRNDKELYEMSSTCEDPGLDPLAKNDGDALITGYPSYGILSYQPGTFLTYAKKYNAYPAATDEPITFSDKYLEKYAVRHSLSNKDRQTLAAIYDPYLQIYIGRLMINEDQGYQWTCYNTLNLAYKYPWKTKSEAISKSSS